MTTTLFQAVLIFNLLQFVIAVFDTNGSEAVVTFPTSQAATPSPTNFEAPRN
jgi:hypothetical protein